MSNRHSDQNIVLDNEDRFFSGRIGRDRHRAI